jgi:prepilin-type N-terminal cleavage/methylation domain-containing protein
MMKRTRGFTLMELAIAIAIMGIIAVLILARYREAQKNYILSQAVQQFVGNIRQAQNMAVTGSNVPGQPQIGGYGVYIINTTSYQLFINTTSDNNGCPSGSRVLINQPINLPSGVSIDNTTTNVFFAPPRPKTCVNGNSANSITYTLRLSSSTRILTVTVDKYGKIDNP